MEISIKDLVGLICRLMDYQGKIRWDATKPDGTPRKWLDVSVLHGLGWHHTISLDEGLRTTYEWYVKNHS